MSGGARPLGDSNGNDQFVVSPDGKWIAIIAGTSTNNFLYVVSVANPSQVTLANPTILGAPAAFVSQPTFTLDSGTLYFLSSATGGQHKSIYLVSMTNPGAAVLVSKQSDPATSDDISAFTVAQDQSSIVEQANRLGREGIWYVDARALTSEAEVDAPTAGVAVTSSTVGRPAGLGGSNGGKVVAYDVGVPGAAPTSVGIFLANVSSTPNPRLVTPLETVLGFSPDNSKLLYTDSAQVRRDQHRGRQYRRADRHGQSGLVRFIGQHRAAAKSGLCRIRPQLQRAAIRLSGAGHPSGHSGVRSGCIGICMGSGDAQRSAGQRLGARQCEPAARERPGSQQPGYPAAVPRLVSSTPSLQSPVHLTSYVSKVVTR